MEAVKGEPLPAPCRHAVPPPVDVFHRGPATSTTARELQTLLLHAITPGSVIQCSIVVAQSLGPCLGLQLTHLFLAAQARTIGGVPLAHSPTLKTLKQKQLYALQENAKTFVLGKVRPFIVEKIQDLCSSW